MIKGVTNGSRKFKTNKSICSNNMDCFYIFSLNFSDQDFNAVLKCFISAAEKMQKDGWWWKNPEMSNKTIKRSILREMFNAWRQSLKAI